MSNDCITINQVTKRFLATGHADDVLRHVSFHIPRGSFTILFGPSGSGKTTLINLIAGLLEPTSGSVTVEGQDIYRLDADERALFRAQHMGIFHQTNYWMHSLDVIENVAMPLYLSGSPKEQALAAARTSLERVGMEDFAHAAPFYLSGGQQQEVSLARSLVANAEIILADEPTGNLDSKSGRHVMDLLSRAHDEFHCTVVLITHNLEYLTYGTNHLFINDGIVTEPQPGQPLPTAVRSSLQTQIKVLTDMEQKQL